MVLRQSGWPLLCILVTSAAVHAAPCALHVAAALDAGAVYVDRSFLTGAQLSDCQCAVLDLNVRCHSKAGEVGRAQDLRLDKQLRSTSILDLNSESVWPLIPAALLRTLNAIDVLRNDLAQVTGRPLLGSIELQLLAYSRGGHYARHVDDVPATVDGAAAESCMRSVSMLLYLTSDDWYEADGGQLRIHAPCSREATIHEYIESSRHSAEQQAGPLSASDPRISRSDTALDILPTGGTLVVFDSTTVPHEVLPTNRARSVLAAWLLQKREAPGTT